MFCAIPHHENTVMTIPNYKNTFFKDPELSGHSAKIIPAASLREEVSQAVSLYQKLPSRYSSIYCRIIEQTKDHYFSLV